MIDLSQIYHPSFDKPKISRLLFYPRQEVALPPGGGPERLMIPVEEEGVVLGGRFHAAGKAGPTILFFHGNGEIAADYDDVGPLYGRMGINFLPIDYRGYGISTGSPSITAMLRDAHRVLSYVSSWLGPRGYNGPLVVMGRSLGSAPALELAYREGGSIAGLIIESGFARILPLMKLLGVEDPELKEAEGPLNVEKIRHIVQPTLVIHAQYDRIIPRSEGAELYRASGAAKKLFVEIPGADHNDILLKGMRIYLETIGKFTEMVQEGKR
jgi:uncharacterized protein